jgi:hypothetical protein
MDIAYVSALSALAGSVIGGFTSGLTNWANQHSQARAERLAHDFSRREDLYRDFIDARSQFATNRRLRTEGHGGNDHNLFLPEQDGAGTT